VLTIALANKLARIAWAVLARGCANQPKVAADAVNRRALRSTKGMEAIPSAPPRSPAVAAVSERGWLRGNGFT
jgi:hypothetical protein